MSSGKHARGEAQGEGKAKCAREAHLTGSEVEEEEEEGEGEGEGSDDDGSEEDPIPDASRRCEVACYHAAFCGRGPIGGTHVPPNASDMAFQGVLDYLSSSPPPLIDYIIPPEHLTCTCSRLFCLMVILRLTHRS